MLIFHSSSERLALDSLIRDEIDDRTSFKDRTKRKKKTATTTTEFCKNNSTSQHTLPKSHCHIRIHIRHGISTKLLSANRAFELHQLAMNLNSERMPDINLTLVPTFRYTETRTFM